MSNLTTCPKCSGKGVISSLAHVKNGLCFDCDGKGTVALIISRNVDLRSARAVGDAVLAGTPVADSDATAALAYFEKIGPCAWRTKDYARRNALVTR